MKHALIFGVNGFAEQMAYYLKRTPGAPEAVGFVVNRAYIGAPSFAGLPVFALETLSETHPPDRFGVYVCVGYSRMNQNRRQVYESLEALGYSVLSYIHPSAQVDARKIGTGTIALQNVVVDVGCELGDGNIIYNGSLVAHHTKLGNFNFVSVCTCVAGDVNINDHCFIGANATVRNGLYIADYTLVGAGVCVTKDTRPYDVIVNRRSYALENKTSLDFL